MTLNCGEKYGLRRATFRVLLILGIVYGLRHVGVAQGEVADFEITISTPRGEIEVTCARGCNWGRDASGPVRVKTFRCDNERCQSSFNGFGRITLGIPLR